MRTSIHVIQLLDVVRRGGSVGPLISQGLELSQIAEILTHAKEAQLVTEDENLGLTLTEAGSMLLNTFRDRDGQGKRRWIEPLEEYRTPRLDKEAIYLPVVPPE